jgi:CxxC motif-containing protein (DUF1111 family)
MKSSRNYILPTLMLLATWACTPFQPQGPEAEMALDAPVAGLNAVQLQTFFRGAEEFDEHYTTASGLGPTYVATSCSSCHGADNRGPLSLVLTRFGQSDSTGNHFIHMGGPQLQHRAIAGFLPETLPAGAPSSRFIAPITSGVGFLESVPDETILALADPNDLNQDGISGRVHWINLPSFIQASPTSLTNNGRYVGRFGHKASAHNLLQQTAQAYNQDMGITTSLLPLNPISPSDGVQIIPTGSPDISDEALNNTVFYLLTLQQPIQRNADLEEVVAGKQVFRNLQCQACHVEALETGPTSVLALSNQRFYPYTDLLLHDMGDEINDGYTEGFALASEWRTAPLWGLGLAKQAQGGQYYLMHDGRAHSIEEAIELHGGEGQGSRSQFQQLSSTKKQQLIAFLESL